MREKTHSKWGQRSRAQETGERRDSEPATSQREDEEAIPRSHDEVVAEEVNQTYTAAFERANPTAGRGV